MVYQYTRDQLSDRSRRGLIETMIRAETGTGSHSAAGYDLLIVGGGINGTGIARDAAGRGLSVLLVEKDDLASHTSSVSTKLIHGGLRYLEYGEFRLVHEALAERERLLAMAPHIIWPLEFVLPQMNSPRPAWVVRLGLFLYDHLGGRKKLPATRSIRLDRDPIGNDLKSGATRAFIYSDCWVEDSRLVALNALDAGERGAVILTRTRLVDAERTAGGWTATIEDGHGTRQIHAKVLVNAAGPWVADVLSRVRDAPRNRSVRLVKGSHIVLPKLFCSRTQTGASSLPSPTRRDSRWSAQLTKRGRARQAEPPFLTLKCSTSATPLRITSNVRSHPTRLSGAFPESALSMTTGRPAPRRSLETMCSISTTRSGGLRR
jgi:glycerol-3-phosphate dehydrogenase